MNKKIKNIIEKILGCIMNKYIKCLEVVYE